MSVMETAIGLLAPPLCVGCGVEGVSICGTCLKTIQPFGERCWRCNKLSAGCRTCDACRHTGSPSRVYIFTDYDYLARQLLVSYKFGHQRAAAGPIANAMTRTLEDFPDSTGYLIVPVPTATSRRRQRGFGHTELLAKHVSWNLKSERKESLRRIGHSRQLGATRDQRLTQLENSFTAHRPSSIRGRKILLIDDVVTTGGTMIAATEALREAGASSVDALIFAKRL